MSRGATGDFREAPMRNWATNPKALSTPGGYTNQTPVFTTTASVASYVTEYGLGNGTTSAYQVVTGTGPISGDTNMRMAFPHSSGKRIGSSNGIVTVSADIYCSQSIASACIEIGFSTAFIKGSTFTLAPGWQRIVSKVKIPAAADDFLTSQVQLLTISGTIAQSSTWKVTRVLIESGSFGHDYVDGDSPGWRWEGGTSNATSIGLPLPFNVLPDPINMSKWSEQRYLASDANAIPGCPYPYVETVYIYDTRVVAGNLSDNTTVGMQYWICEGFAAAPSGASNNLTIAGRYGNVYNNSPPTNGYFGAYSGSKFGGTLLPSNYNGVWRPFKVLIKGTIPSGGQPRLTPNIAGSGWQIAGVTMRRALPSEL